ncbi:MAG TPA: hypothetical protein VNH84_12320, partial [Candidatus Saccharimonadales bacterium]|nr:hypothetical protein [Candidatus Saccharimonadales bacterium]
VEPSKGKVGKIFVAYGLSLPNDKSERWRRPSALDSAKGARPPPFAPLACYVRFPSTSCDYDRDAKRYLQSGEHLQAGVGHLNSGVVAVRTVSAEYVNFVSLLQGPQVFRVWLQYLPERFDVPSQRLSFRQCRF